MSTPSKAVLLAILLGAPPALGQQAQPNAAGPAAASVPHACAASASYASCTGGCEPGKLIFLSCMAVGANGMAACRQREVAACLRACASRHCS